MVPGGQGGPRASGALQLPDGGTQLFHRVAIDRVGRAVAAALDRAPDGLWACNVADPTDFTYGGLARLVAERFDWEWELEPVAWEQSDHPWNVRQPVFTDTTRLRGDAGRDRPRPGRGDARPARLAVGEPGVARAQGSLSDCRNRRPVDTV